MSVSPITNALPALSSKDRGVQAGAPPPVAERAAVSEAPRPEAPRPEVQLPARARPPQESELREAVEDANRHFQEQSLNLQYSMDDDTKKMIIRLVDASTGEVIRQIPNEEMLAIARALDRAMSSGSGFAIQTEA